MFSETIFGPIHSRRLGTSLGINLSPRDGKVCTFDCLYCEAGYNAQGTGSSGLPRRAQVASLLELRLTQLRDEGVNIDVITFSGNGEPTVNPDFADIIDDTIALRDRYYPEARVSVLCNSTMLHRPAVVAALLRADNAIMKLDSAIQRTVELLDRPTSPSYDVATVIEQLAAMGNKIIIQTMLTYGSHDGEEVDNTGDAEIAALCEAYRRIAPRRIMLYSLDRPTPEQSLHKVERERLVAIGERISAATGIEVSIA